MSKFTNLLDKIIHILRKLLGKKENSQPQSSSEPKIGKTYGGFEFRKAKEDPSAGIENLKISSDKLSYSWKSGCGLKGWGLAKTQAGAIAVLVVRRNGKTTFDGGKFDWISESRKTRDFKNIRGGYGGWPNDSIEAGAEFAFCIVSEDGKRRTNWIFYKK